MSLIDSTLIKFLQKDQKLNIEIINYVKSKNNIEPNTYEVKIEDKIF
jgi:hypothetical protein